MMAEARPLYPFPLTTEEIDRECLTAALRVNVPDAKVLGFAIDDIFNATGTSVRLQLQLNEAATRPEFRRSQGWLAKNVTRLSASKADPMDGQPAMTAIPST
jgi:hypothetical protein